MLHGRESDRSYIVDVMGPRDGDSYLVDLIALLWVDCRLTSFHWRLYTLESCTRLL